MSAIEVWREPRAIKSFQRIRGGLCQSHRAFTVLEEATGVLDKRQFLVRADRCDVTAEEIQELSMIPPAGERPDSSPQKGLEVHKLDVVRTGDITWRVVAWYRPMRRTKDDYVG